MDPVVPQLLLEIWPHWFEHLVVASMQMGGQEVGKPLCSKARSKLYHGGLIPLPGDSKVPDLD